MPKPRTGSIYYRKPHWRGVITTDAGRRYVYAKTEDEVRAKLKTLGAAPPAHPRQEDLMDARVQHIASILARGKAKRWDAETTARVIAVSTTRSRLRYGVVGPCVYCGSEFANTVDHVVALTNGGHDGRGNVVSSCKPCNMRKGSRTP